MNANKHIFGLVLSTALAGLAAPAQAQDQTVSGEQIKATWVGKKVFGRSTTGGLIDLYLKADGTSQVSVGNMVDSGRWRPTETGYCATWQKLRSGEERCFTVVQRGGKLLILNPDGSTGTEVIRVVE